MLRRPGLLAAVLLLAACNRVPDPPPRVTTGAEEAARAFCDALVRKDWPAAYQMLTPAEKKRLSEPAFTRLAERDLAQRGFTPTTFQVWGCDETGDEAIAHVSLQGTRDAGTRFARDALALRRNPAGLWQVVLPPYFGQRPGR